MTNELQEKIGQLKQLQKKMYAFTYASNSIYLDGVTVAPSETQEGRSEAQAVLAEYAYELTASKETTELLKYLKLHEGELDAHTRRETELLLRDSEYTASIPQNEYTDYVRLTNDAEYVWHKAKAENDFEMFRPYLQQIFDTLKRFALYYRPSQDPYQTQLDMFEKGLTVEKCDGFFEKLRTHIVPLIKKISEVPQIDDGVLYGNFPLEQQRKLTKKIMDCMDIDEKHCVCGETEHPFTLDFGRDDVRITTHYYQNSAMSSMYSVIHEGGHALYELGGGAEHKYTAVSGGVSMGVHESQSRFYENIIGKRRAFTDHILPKLQLLFPQLADVDADSFYRMVNKAEPSLIRTEADELTYCLHIMVRYEIEKKMFAGEITAMDIPSEWNRLYKEYLGIDVPDDTHGCLQDSHWSGGMVGYFPSYALGSAYGAQLLNLMQSDVDVDAACRSGSLKPVSDWLRERIWKHARMYDPEELLCRAFDGPFDPDFYVKYLEEKFSDIYNI